MLSFHALKLKKWVKNYYWRAAATSLFLLFVFPILLSLRFSIVFTKFCTNFIFNTRTEVVWEDFALVTGFKSGFYGIFWELFAETIVKLKMATHFWDAAEVGRVEGAGKVATFWPRAYWRHEMPGWKKGMPVPAWSFNKLAYQFFNIMRQEHGSGQNLASIFIINS